MGGDQLMIPSAVHTDEMDYSVELISTGISMFDRQRLQAVLFYHGEAGIDFRHDVIPAAVVLGLAPARRRLKGDLSPRRRNPGRPASCAFFEENTCQAASSLLGCRPISRAASITMAGTKVPDVGRLRNTLIAHDVRIPDDTVTSSDPAKDARRFHHDNDGHDPDHPGHAGSSCRAMSLRLCASRRLPALFGNLTNGGESRDHRDCRLNLLWKFFREHLLQSRV